MRKTDTNIYFWGSHYSQWFKQNNLIEEDGIFYNSAEKYMMVKKAELFGDIEIKNQMLQSNDPKKVKSLGRKISNFNDKKWNENKVKIVTQGNYLKFSQNKKLLDILLEDKKYILVEASPVDKIWGVGLHYEDDKILKESNWRGENLLGISIMAAREQILNNL